jgi:tetratricopeptide (TPR) repeat protein
MPRKNPMKQFQGPWRHSALCLLLLTTSACNTSLRPPKPIPDPIPIETVDNALHQAIALYEAGDFAAAEARLHPLRTTHPNNAQAALYLGRVYFATENYAEAVDELQHTVDLEGDLALHHLWLGRALGEQVHRVPAVLKLPLAKRIHAAFLQALELDPERTETHLALARFYSEAPPFAGGDPAAARRHAQRLTELDPPAGYRLQGSLFERLEQLGEAETAYRTAIEADAEDAESYQQAGEFFERQERLDLAQEMFDRARALRPDRRSGDR